MTASKQARASKRTSKGSPRVAGSKLAPNSGVAVRRRCGTEPGAGSNQERYEMIAEAAYFRAAERSFCPGHELEDWLAAEAEVEQRLAAR